jgi:phosphoglycerate dehydrogenase-like enzyme
LSEIVQEFFRVQSNQNLKVTISLRPPLADPIIQRLESLPFDIQATRTTDLADIMKELKTSDVYVATRCSKDHLQAGRGRIQLVQMFGVGINNIDLSAAESHSVMVAVTPVNHIAVAEHTFALLLAMTKRIIPSDQTLRTGSWSEGFANGNPSVQLRGKTIGIIGFGRIGQEVARIARGFGMRVIAIKQHPYPHSWVQVLGSDQLETLLKESDFVIVACPLTKATEGLIGRKELELMKPTAFLVNIARGKIIDENALYESLYDKQIAGAGLDAWYLYLQEDRSSLQLPSSRAFHQLENVVMTPHRAAYDRETFEATIDFIVSNIGRLASGKRPLGLVQL